MSISLGRVVDLRDRQTRIRLRLSDADLRASDHQACRLVGGTAEWLGLDGLIVPSARAEGANLVVFPRRAGPGYAPSVLASRDLPAEGER